jgi:hypothetical protein
MNTFTVWFVAFWKRLPRMAYFLRSLHCALNMPRDSYSLEGLFHAAHHTAYMVACAIFCSFVAHFPFLSKFHVFFITFFVTGVIPDITGHYFFLFFFFPLELR